MSIINSEEWLYRYVPVSPDTRYDPPLSHYELDDTGRLKFLTYTAFNDRNRQPSCDRTILLTDPKEAKSASDAKDGVVKIQVLEIEQISGSTLHDESSGRIHYAFFSPTESRPAHSQIMTEPAFGLKGKPEKNRWKAFQEYLAAAASKHGWVIEPGL